MLPVGCSSDGCTRIKDSGGDSWRFTLLIKTVQWAVTTHLQNGGSISVSQLHNQGGTSVFWPAVGRRPPPRLVCATSNAPFSHPPQSCSLFSFASTSGSFGRLKISLSVTKEKKVICGWNLKLFARVKKNKKQPTAQSGSCYYGRLTGIICAHDTAETRDVSLTPLSCVPKRTTQWLSWLGLIRAGGQRSPPHRHTNTQTWETMPLKPKEISKKESSQLKTKSVSARALGCMHRLLGASAFITVADLIAVDSSET